MIMDNIFSIKIERGTKNGCKYCNTYIDDVPVGSGVSRKVTGTIDEDGWGVFSPHGERAIGDRYVVKFWYGDATKLIEVQPISYSTDPIDVISAELARRIRAVRAWVASVDHAEVLTATISL